MADEVDALQNVRESRTQVSSSLRGWVPGETGLIWAEPSFGWGGKGPSWGHVAEAGSGPEKVPPSPEVPLSALTPDP